MLSFIVTGAVLAVTFAVALAITVANSMSDAPSSDGIHVWPVFLVGLPIAALLIISHYIHLSW